MSKKLFILLILTCYIQAFGQLVIYNDNCETSGRNWNGVPTINSNSGYIAGSTAANDRPSSSNFYTSSSRGFTIYGFGNSSSSYETELYQLPNITGLQPTKTYKFKFKIMAYAEDYVSQTQSGLDNLDYIDIGISTNNGVTYTTESRITGASNCYWSFNATGSVTETANGLLDIYTPTGGGNRELTGDGYSTYNLTITGVSQIAVRISMRANYGTPTVGEWWVIDDMQLWDMTPISLPIELISFEAKKYTDFIRVIWQTASESNNDYFIVERSVNGFDFYNIIQVKGAGNSTQLLSYFITDTEYANGVNYYRLKQYDYDGKETIHAIISVDATMFTSPKLRTVNTLGQEVDEYYRGVVFDVFLDGTSVKRFQ